MKTFYSCDKDFLNEVDKLTAFINWKVEIDTCMKKNNRFKCKGCKFKKKCEDRNFNSIDSYIEIKDCNDAIKLDFDIDGESTKTDKFIKNEFRKINTLLKHLRKFKKEYLKAIEILKENKKEKK
jgi:hypothetical protein